jgi:hypothetical protein
MNKYFSFLLPKVTNDKSKTVMAHSGKQCIPSSLNHHIYITLSPAMIFISHFILLPLEFEGDNTTTQGHLKTS